MIRWVGPCKGTHHTGPSQRGRGQAPFRLAWRAPLKDILPALHVSLLHALQEPEAVSEATYMQNVAFAAKEKLGGSTYLRSSSLESKISFDAPQSLVRCP